MMEDEARRIAFRLTPDGGWWRSDTEEAIVDVALFMLEAGCPEDAVEEHLRSLVAALRSEYGE